MFKDAKKLFKSIGPGMIITASFIGPGTVTTMTQGGAGFGYSLLWAVVFSIVATIVLQEMIIRLSLVTREGLGEAIQDLFANKIGKLIIVWFTLIAVTLGCAAYISGDLIGTSLGAAYLLHLPENAVAPIIGVIILLIGLFGNYRFLEKIMIFLMVIMGIIFITTMIVIKPDIIGILKGIFVPTIPNGSIITIIALIGTTVVPYNFFIHSTAVHERFGDIKELKFARWDTIISISIGGIISAAILIAAATLIKGKEVTSIIQLAGPLEPVLGNAAPFAISIGLFAAGLSSAIASPTGAAATISSLLGWQGGMESKKYKFVFTCIIIIGIITSALGFEPLQVLLVAQALNGIILPTVAILIFIVINKRNLMGNYVNTVWLNIIGGIVVIVVTFLGVYSLIDAINSFIQR
ncbi:Nramp family divalent metal transporter [Staphylococcus gallinarum]|uniref:Divalent metal cation transporter n=1 Tax=Staphylococcus gallinarum TaxID=1293 RepID=A0A418HN35_STAGA|nr:Nramp family divalent metal transporter [Staphylococcus gallinarum]MCD8827235.1 Nramp family divalent metal transporter [Staphylococcus gallinarum]MEB6243521.1 Nramp family divalent metal transporter [Staphylococcus gallinarum]MEB6296561.1 Nramp family divalent metal transporter [Staphylococcus gallinarum]PTE76447.1 manganese transporter [Staphylococcus gallinarum]RIL42655.1 divalent metal cation transporter [Staphylococcus gallinarum]